MNRKKWNIITVISLAAIVVELVLVFALIIPSARYNNFFKKLEMGNEEAIDDAEDYYEDMNLSQRNKVDKKMPDFATYICNQYADGKITYQQLDEIYEAIDEIEGEYDYCRTYYVRANYKELTDLYEQAVAEYKTNGASSLYYELDNRFYDAYDNTYGDSELDNALVRYLEDKYNLYKNGSITFEVIEQYVDVATDFFHGDALSFALDTDSELYSISIYQDRLEEAQEYYDSKDYFETMRTCDSQLSYMDENDSTGYREKFQQLRDDAYETGKTYYVEQVKQLLNNDERYDAEYLIERIQETYGDDVDLSEVEAMMQAPWEGAYKTYMQNWQENLKADVAGGVKVGDLDDSSLINVDENMPDKFFLYDFDDNDTPEFGLVGDNYFYIYGFDGTKAVLTGVFKIAGMADVPYLITIPAQMEAGYTGYELLRFSNNSWSVEHYYLAADDGSRYVVDGQETDVDTCAAMHDTIAAHENQEVSNITTTIQIDYYEQLIDAYED